MSLTTKSIDFAITKAPQVINTTTGAISKAVGSIFSSTTTRGVVQAATSSSSQTANQITRHGLEEIVVEARLMDKGGIITHEGARISHPAPVRARFNEPHVIVRDQVFYYSNKIGPNGCAVRHEITRLPNGDIKIKFFDKNNEWVDSVETIKYNPNTRPITDKDEIAKLLEEARKKPSKPAEVLPEITEPHFQGFKKPKGATSCARITASDGTSTVTFRDKDGNLLREIKCDKSGYPVEYTNYERTYENIKGRVIKDEHGIYIPVAGESRYDEVVMSSTYRINDLEVLGTKQIKEVTHHDCQRIGKTFKTTVERRGSFEEVTIESGDKRINEFFFSSGAASKGRLASNSATGLTKEEIKLIQSDPYLSSRYYNDGTDFVESSSPIIFAEEGIRNPSRTVITFEPPNKNEYGYHQANPVPWGATERRGGRINITPSHAQESSRGRVINTEAHETRHAHQYDIMEDRKNHKLSGEEKEFADKLQDARDHYVRPEDDYDGYYNNLMEVDARQAGEKAEQIFDRHGEIQRKIFTA